MFPPYADELLSMTYKIAWAFIEGVNMKWADTARELGLSEQTIHKIQNAHQDNTEFCCKKMIEECLIGREEKMDWHSFTELLKKLQRERELIDNFFIFWGKSLVTDIITLLNSLCLQEAT